MRLTSGPTPSDRHFPLDEERAKVGREATQEQEKSTWRMTTYNAATSYAQIQGAGMGIKNQVAEECDGVPFIRPR